VSGYADIYWKYDLSQQNNIKTYFANDQNSISLGMLAVELKKTTNRATFVGEISFGPRGQYLTLPTGDENDPYESFHIQNLYASYNFSDDFNITAGYMGTFIGYEVISPIANFHYSTSYLFGAGPFQNAGIKVTYLFSDKISLMAGLFDDWNVYLDLNGVSHFGALLAINPTESLSSYVNFLTGTSANGKEDYTSGTLIDLVANYAITDNFNLGLNAADYSQTIEGGYQGVALYPQQQITDNIKIGLRGEYFKTKNREGTAGETYITTTLSGNLTHGGLTLIPEIRLDNNTKPLFLNKSGNATKHATQASIAVVYSF
jgi:hypothetical protein